MREIKQKDLELRLENIELAILEIARGLDLKRWGWSNEYARIYKILYVPTKKKPKTPKTK